MNASMRAEHMVICQNKTIVHQDNKDTQTTNFLLAPTEVLHQHLIQDVPSRNPAPLLRTIALPVHQILEAPAPASDQDYEEK